MKRDFFKIRKRIMVGCLTAAIAVVQPVSSVFANPHYDRRDTVAEEEFILQELPVQSHQEKK